MVLRLRKNVSQSFPLKIVASEEETDASFDAVSKEVSIGLKLFRVQNSTVVGGKPGRKFTPRNLNQAIATGRIPGLCICQSCSPATPGAHQDQRPWHRLRR